MKELFLNKTKCTQKEYDRFMQTQVKEHAVSELLYTLFNIAFFTFCTIFAFMNKEYKLGIIIIIGLLIYGWYKFIRPIKMVRKEKKSNKLIKEYVNTYKFYKNFFTTENPDGKAQTFYFKIYKVIETKTHFYIYIARDYAFIVAKNGFIDSDGEDFKEFIKKKVKFKYKTEKTEAQER